MRYLIGFVNLYFYFWNIFYETSKCFMPRYEKSRNNTTNYIRDKL